MNITKNGKKSKTMKFGLLCKAKIRPKCLICNKKLEPGDYRIKSYAGITYHLNCYIKRCKRVIKDYQSEIIELKTKHKDKLKEEKEVLVLRGI